MPDLNLSVRFSLRKYSSKASLDVITPVESKIEDISEAELPWGIFTFIICKSSIFWDPSIVLISTLSAIEFVTLYPTNKKTV